MRQAPSTGRSTVPCGFTTHGRAQQPKSHRPR
jgi:hypothetical protein